jgi:hypothetical protein
MRARKDLFAAVMFAHVRRSAVAKGSAIRDWGIKQVLHELPVKVSFIAAGKSANIPTKQARSKCTKSPFIRTKAPPWSLKWLNRDRMACRQVWSRKLLNITAARRRLFLPAKTNLPNVHNEIIHSSRSLA